MLPFRCMLSWGEVPWLWLLKVLMSIGDPFLWIFFSQKINALFYEKSADVAWLLFSAILSLLLSCGFLRTALEAILCMPDILRASSSGFLFGKGVEWHDEVIKLMATPHAQWPHEAVVAILNSSASYVQSSSYLYWGRSFKMVFSAAGCEFLLFWLLRVLIESSNCRFFPLLFSECIPSWLKR